MAWKALSFFLAIITIQSVELKNQAGQWVAVAHPDHQVDLAVEEPAVSFVNQGRIPNGQYGNFRILFTEENKSGTSELSGVGDFAESLNIKRTSFVHVCFDLDAPARRVNAATITVDDQTRTLDHDSLSLKP